VFRILPLYYVSIVIVLVANAVLGQSPTGFGNIVAHVGLVQTLFVNYRVAINSVLWTLSIEWMFYVLMLLVALRFRRRRQGWAIAIGMLVLGVGWRIWISVAYKGEAIQLNFLDKQLPGAADAFACGMIVALLVQNPRVRAWAAHRRVAIVGLTVSLIGMAVGLRIFDHWAGTVYWSSQAMVIAWPLGFSVACAGCVLFIRCFEEPLGPVLKWTGLAYLGLISYSIYLFHTLVITALYRGYGATHPRGPVWLLLPAVLVGTIVVSAVTYHFVERPFIHLRRRWSRPGGSTARPDDHAAEVAGRDRSAWLLAIAVAGMAIVMLIVIVTADNTWAHVPSSLPSPVVGHASHA
jgi:peptidoglycan/LPS O-acetylase OafA/YrhL